MKNIFTILLVSSLSLLTFALDTILIVSKLNNRPVMDGYTTEWSGNWKEIKWIYGGSTTNAMTARFMTGCTADTLYFAFEVNDTTPNNKYVEGTYRNDCITLMLSMDSTRKLFKFETTIAFINQRDNSSLTAPSELIKDAIKTRAAGNEKKYCMEWALPYSVLDSYKSSPRNGDKIAFNARVSDNTGETDNPAYDGLTQINYWFPDGDMSSGFINCAYFYFTKLIFYKFHLCNAYQYWLGVSDAGYPSVLTF